MSRTVTSLPAVAGIANLGADGAKSYHTRRTSPITSVTYLDAAGRSIALDAGDHSRVAPRRRTKKPTTTSTIRVPMMAEMMPPKSNMSVSPMPRPTVKIR